MIKTNVNNNQIQMHNHIESDDIHIESDDIHIESDDSFHTIVEQFCLSLAMFTDAIIEPTIITTMKIHKKVSRDTTFDSYVNNITNCNEIIRKITIKIKDIIISLNKLFIERELEKLIDFITCLISFLLYLLNENIFDKLNDIKLDDIMYKNRCGINEKIIIIKNLIFNIFIISINITTLFIPQLKLVNEVITILEDKTSNANNMNEINDQSDTIRKNNLILDIITKQLLDIQLRNQITSNFDINRFFIVLMSKKTNELLYIITNLQDKYIDLMNKTLILKTEAIFYTTKNKTVFSRFLKYLKNI